MSRRLLIVDDSPAFAAAARDLLSAGGFEVIGVARTGADAVRMATDLAPAIVLLDVGLPDLDGFAVAGRLVGLADPPAVVLTSSRDWADLGRRILACGALGFLPKDRLDADAVATVVGSSARSVR